VANTFIGGTAGRIKVDTVTIAGIKSWNLDQTTAEIGLPNFESATDALARVWPAYISGLSGATGTLEGYFDINAGNPTDDALTVSGTDSASAFYTLQLLFDKSSVWGFEVSALITNFRSGTNVENQPATFTANFRVTGAVPLSAPL
jgi:hypothetical protein